ncbi:CBL-interacting serine/threonine-protein kinase 7-like [Solanum stenotomum]|uniref:CBL-interacting serine/threonine-protein kinase 7-like n=1 Tax=Solanum stenotomum TaxID=172797 RepID=UPI0020CFEAD0|nr:CBL-interacting serine/threonine-protein kinase 7-like [Solanum stenotomum]
MEAKYTQPPSSATRIRRTTSTNGSGAGNGSIILGKYQLGRFLGRGSFAKVYHGLCLDDNTNIAIKVIDKKSIIGTDVSMEPRIIREISAMSRLNHPNIIKLNEVMATKSKIYLVMEIASGGDLHAKLIRHGRFSDSTARFYFHQLVSALHYCHQNGVTHRDIKPQNILLDQNNNLKISDFGLSALPEQLKNGLLHTACGTPGYTAPEVAYRKGYNGEKADSWSCGVILFAFLSGYHPFDSANLSNMCRAIHRRDLRFPNWVSKSARSVINKLLDPNPSTRLSIEQLMKLSWFKKSNQQQKSSDCVFEKNRTNLGGINAFDIISMSSGLNLSRLFESDLSKREMKFTTNARIEEIEEKVMKIGEEGGYRVERGKGRGIELVKGRVVLMVEILEVAMELLLVEVKVVNNGGLEFDDSQWEELKFGMNDICSFMVQ